MVVWLGVGLGGLAAEPLRVFIWSEYLDPEVVQEFEAREGVRVTLDLYEDAESMMAKLQAGGTGQYDVVVPPDHLVVPMVKLGLLAPLRAERMPNRKHLDPRFLGLPFDPENRYTVAYQWGTVGLYYRKQGNRPAPDSWAVLFDSEQAWGPMVLIDSMRDAVGAALKYRGHSMNSTDTAALREAQELLVATKRRSVGMEGSVGGRNRVLARTAAVAVVYSGEAARGMAEDGETGYVIPKEGSQIWVDNLAIPARAPNRDVAERFINYLLEPEVGAKVSIYTRFATPNRAARERVPPEDLANGAIYPSAEVMDRLEYIEDLGAKTQVYDRIWTRVKAR